ncbi:MAG: IPTL-CTERM sorting domain-containing protein [Thermoanaerobaculia bacterium]|nr:IPTL-CTERM sorting domain-containing protein [Thermoanaerobaculia bacterium]
MHLRRSLIALFTALLAIPASASLILSTPDQTDGTGLGAVNTVLTVQTEDATIRDESGCVSWNGMSDVVGPAACPPGIPGGDEQEQTQTRTLNDLGLTSAFNLRVVFNYNEDTADNITLEDLVLRIFGTDGTVLFESGAFDPRTFDEPFSGTGNAGFVYRLDAEQAADANQYFDDLNNRIGLAAELTGAEGGLETFFVADAAAIVAPSADVAIAKSDSPDPVVVGETLTYTLTARNNGPNTATDVTVVDTLPSSVTFESVNTTTGSCTQSGQIVTCSLGSLATGQEETITITVTPNTAGVTIVDSVSIAADQSDPVTANNTATESTQVIAATPPRADVAVTKSDSPDPVDVGATLSYTLTVSNTGPDPATGVTVTDSLPSSVNFQSATPSQGACSHSAGTVTCDLGTINSGANATIQIDVTPTSPGDITNTANVSANESDPNTANNSASETTTVSAPQADLSITKTDSPDPVTSGSTLTYTLQVTNNGPDSAAGVVVTDTLPSSVTFQSVTPSQGTCSQSGRTVTCDLGTLANGANATITIEVTPTESGTITNSASVGSDTEDPNGANNNASESTTVDAPAPEQIDLSITKTDNPDPVRVGDSLAYTIEVSNAGPDTASGVTVTDSLPSTVTFDSATPSQGSCSVSGQTVTCDIGSLGSGGTATVTIRVTPGSQGTITNNVNVSGNEDDTDLSNNSASESTTVEVAQVDLVLDKIDNPDPVAENETLTYTINVNNSGPGTATNVRLTDTLPSTVTYDSSSTTQGSCSQSGRTVTCDLGTLASGGSATVTITVTTDPVGSDQTITNSASVTSDETDTNPANNSESEQTTVLVTAPPRADLAVTKSDSPDPATVGEPLTYTLNLVNNGPEDATGVTLTDSLPSGATFDSVSSSQGSCSHSEGVVSCSLGTILNGGTATVTITVVPTRDGEITNSVTVASDLADPDSTNNSATETTQVGAGAAGADLTILKSDSPDPAVVGQALTYTLTVINGGPNQATGVQVVDTLPALVTFESASSTQGSCTESSGVVTCDLGTVNVGEEVTVTITVVPTETGSITNVASVSANQAEPNPGDNQVTETTDVNLSPAAVPTLGEWSMILLTLMLAGVGVLVIRQT